MLISMHEMLTNQILLFHFSNTLASVCKTNTGAVLRLQIKQAVNYEHLLDPLSLFWRVRDDLA